METLARKRHKTHINPHKVDMGGCLLGVGELELILKVLRDNGRVEISNCAGVMSLIELGAYLKGLKA